SNRIKEGIPPEGEGYAGTFRGQETVVSYTIDPKTGLLGNPQWTNCEGYTPRFMTLTPEGQLLVANMDSDTLQFFAPEGKNGQLHFTGKTVKTESPCTVVFR
ncbi:lactonase family protein, partial [Acidaminococcus fermentans]